jgi:hypothetical protein
MKKLAIIGLPVVIVVAYVLLHWQHVKISRFDRDFRQNLAGTWSTEVEIMRKTNVVKPEGSFISQLIFIHPERTNTYQQTGTWLVKDGHLIETVESDTNPTAVTPWTRVGRIIRADASEFVVRWQGSPDELLWHKVIQ